MDTDPLKGLGYYRLKIVDFDGRFKYSPVVSVTNRELAVISISPNPVSNTLIVNYPESAAGASIWIFAADGKKLMEQYTTQQGSKMSINVSSLERGVYELIFISGDEKLNARFLKH